MYHQVHLKHNVAIISLKGEELEGQKWLAEGYIVKCASLLNPSLISILPLLLHLISFRTVL